ncbi:ABC transporter substrate-binding protein [Paenibacillus sp. M1]|uniref:ABC transporter substrate-binding protein n=1 Tax=Paenibacillus haidiansis TaxID=1574488 RepID=A0ABU7VTE1_9BACL
MQTNHKRKKAAAMAWFIPLLFSFILAATGCSSPGNTASKAKADATSEQAGHNADTTGASSGENAEKVTLNIADISSNPVFRTAVNKGIFAKHGIEAKLVTFATPAEGINSLFIKQADIAWGADFPILNAVSKGDFTIVASTGTSTEQNAKQWKLFVRDDIQKPEDLKGKNLSFLRGTFISYLWDEYLAEHGVALADVKLIGQGGSDEAYVALKKGEVDGVWVSGSAMVEKFSAIEGAHELTDMSQTKVRIGSQIVVPNSLIEEHPETVEQFLLALDESSKFVKDHPEEVADILYEEVKQPKEATLKDLSVNNWHVDFTQGALDSLASQKKYMVENGIIQQDFELTDKIDLDFLRDILPDRVTVAP